MCEFAYLQPGYHWELTAAGKAIGRVSAKFEETNKNYKHYQKSVPKSWLEKGWVTMVKNVA